MNTIQAHELTMARTAATTPLMHYEPSQDLTQWQAAAKAKLEELLCLPLQSCEDCYTVTSTEDTDTYHAINFEFQSEPGYFIPCHLLIPLGATKPLPTVISIQGHSTGKHITMGKKKFERDTDSTLRTRDFAVQAIREGMCALVFDQRYMGVSGHQQDGNPHCLDGFSPLAASLWGRTAIGERVWDIMRILDVMEKHLTAHVDMDKIICLGNSGGGTATFYASCMEPRIRVSVPSCAVSTYEASIMAMHHCACNYIPHIRRFFEMGDLGCLIAPRRLVMVSGALDKIFPIEGAKASFEIIKSAYDKIGHPERCHMVIGSGGHQFYPDEAWPVIHTMLEQED